MRLIVTGGAGFIGSNFISYVLNHHYDKIDGLINIDCLTYAGNELNCEIFSHIDKYQFKLLDINSPHQTADVFSRFRPTHVVHLAAESHVDNSIKNPKRFLETNIIGTYNLLRYATAMKVDRFHHVSTDEVYGSLGKKGKFKETTPYDPRNPYSASKASSDHFVRTFHHTYNLPITISNCSNNYGPNQHKEKFIPTVIKNLKKNEGVPVYGDGKNIRDWIYVEDHCDAIWKILTKGKVGETYNVGANCEKTNLEVIEQICKVMGKDFKTSVKFVNDRLGHDFRYAINSSKLRSKLGWKPSHTFLKGIKKTVEYYA